jgi:hypothetical protein
MERQEKIFHPVLEAEGPHFRRVSTSVLIFISFPYSALIKAATAFFFLTQKVEILRVIEGQRYQ